LAVKNKPEIDLISNIQLPLAQGGKAMAIIIVR
jgi:hypothetical protein